MNTQMARSREFFRGLSVDITEANNHPADIIRLVPGLNFAPIKCTSGFVWEEKGFMPAHKKYRVVNSTTGKAIDAGKEVSSHYKTHNIREILESLCEISTRAGLVLSNAAMFNGGEHIVLRAKSTKQFEPVVGDVYGGNVLFRISNVPGITSNCSAFVLRLVCLNGATAKENIGADVMRLHHRQNYDENSRIAVERLAQGLENALKSFEERMEILYQTRIEQGEATKFFLKLLDLTENSEPSRVFNSLVETYENQPGQESTQGTWAHPYNAVTRWVDHERGRKPGSALFSALYGEGARLKNKALSLALDFALGGKE